MERLLLWADDFDDWLGALRARLIMLRYRLLLALRWLARRR